jgi:hypothetical protein
MKAALVSSKGGLTVIIRKFIAPAILITVLLSGGVLLLSNQALAAGCCGCGNCWMMYVYGTQYCYCGGNCPTCFTDDFDPSRRINLGQDEVTNGLYKVPMSSVGRLDATANVTHLLSGTKCFRNEVAFSLLGNARANLKFVPIRFE